MNGLGIAGGVEHGQRILQGKQLVYRRVSSVGNECPCVCERNVKCREEKENDHAGQVKFIVGSSPREEHLDRLIEENGINPCGNLADSSFEARRDGD